MSDEKEKKKERVTALTGWVVESEVRYSHSDTEIQVTLKVCSGITRCPKPLFHMDQRQWYHQMLCELRQF